MDRYLARVWDNIRPFSSETNDVTVALKEWEYTGNMERREEASEVCRLCDHENLRDLFEIKNKFTSHILQVGSKCIEKFSLPVFDSETGNTVTGAEAAPILQRDRRKVLARAKKEAVVSALEALAKKDPRFEPKLKSFLQTHERDGAFSPSQLSLLIWRFEEASLSIPASLSMTFKSNADKKQIREMEDWKLARLLPFMSADQAHRAQALRSIKKPGK